MSSAKKTTSFAPSLTPAWLKMEDSVVPLQLALPINQYNNLTLYTGSDGMQNLGNEFYLNSEEKEILTTNSQEDIELYYNDLVQWLI